MPLRYDIFPSCCYFHAFYFKYHESSIAHSTARTVVSKISAATTWSESESEIFRFREPTAMEMAVGDRRCGTITVSENGRLCSADSKTLERNVHLL